MKQELRSKFTREKITGSASECFAKIGYHQTDVDEICRRANLTKGAFYYHFSSKQDLFLEILDQWINRVGERIDIARIETPDILRALMGIPDGFSPLFLELGNQLPVFLELYVKSFSDPDLKKIILRSYKKFILFFTNILKRGIENGTVRKIDPKEGAEILFSMTVGMFIMPFSAIAMASGNWFGSGEIDLGIFTIHPIALMMIVGISLQALGESFISPRYLEFFSLQAPKGEEGMYLGFSHLHSFLASILGFGLSGYLLSKYCPDPKLFETHEAWESAASNAHYIWYYFAAIALTSAVSLIIYGKVIKRLNAKTKTL